MGAATVHSTKMGQRKFTAEDYEKYSNKDTGMKNTKFRDDSIPLSDIIKSDEADFRTRLDNGEELFQYLKSLGE